MAGVLSLRDAARLVAARGRLMAALPPGGVMVAVAATEAEVAPLLDGGVSVAAVNGPAAVVLSASGRGDGRRRSLADCGRRVRQLAVSHAFHSPLMEPMIGEFSAVAAGVSPGSPRIDLVSNVTGRPAGPGYGSADYWVEHVRRPVRFADGVRCAEALGAGAFVEVGPGAALAAAVEQSLGTEPAVAAVSMAKDRPEVDSLLLAAGQLFASGATWTGPRRSTGWPPTASTCRRMPLRGAGSGCRPSPWVAATPPAWVWPRPSTRCWARWSSGPIRAAWC